MENIPQMCVWPGQGQNNTYWLFFLIVFSLFQVFCLLLFCKFGDFYKLILYNTSYKFKTIINGFDLHETG